MTMSRTRQDRPENRPYSLWLRRAILVLCAGCTGKGATSSADGSASGDGSASEQPRFDGRDKDSASDVALTCTPVLNGDFAKGMDSWSFYADSTAAAVAATAKTFTATVQNGGSRAWNIGLGQAGLHVAKRALYKVEFDAMSPQQYRMTSQVSMNQPPYYQYSGPHYFTLTDQLKHYAYSFPMMQASDTNAQLAFYFGGRDVAAGTTVTITNVTMTCLGTAPEEVIPTDFVRPAPAQMHRGIQFGLQFASPAEGTWGVPFSLDYLDVIKADGRFDSIRLPVLWETRTAAKAPYTIDPEFMHRIDWAVSHSLHDGFHTIVNMHWFHAMETDAPANKDQFLATWAQIAAHFKDYPDYLYFDLLNEPNGAENAVWNTYLALAYDTVRQSNPTRTIIISGTYWAAMAHIADLQLPERILNDPNVMIQFHPYIPSDFLFQGTVGNGTQFENLSGIRWLGTDDDKKFITDQMDGVVAWAKQHNNIRLLNGEFCAHAGTSLREDRLRWTEFIVRESEKRNIPWNYYDFSEDGCAVYDVDSHAFDSLLMDILFPATPTP
jgi:endoglucanase